MKETIIDFKSEDFLFSMVNAIGDPIFVKNNDHKWILLNDAFCEFVGHTKEELLGKSDYDIFPKDQADVFWQKDDEVLKNEKININEETITDAKENMRIIITKKAVYRDETDKKYIVGIIRDITEIKEIEINNKKHIEELEKMNRIMMGREQKLIELKKELDEWKQSVEKCEKSMLI